MSEVVGGIRRETTKRDLQLRMATKAMRFPIPSLGNPSVLFGIEAYLYSVQPTVAGCVRWVIRWAAAQCGKLERWANFVGDSFPTFKNKVEYFLRPYDRDEHAHFVDSTRAMAARARANSQPVDIALAFTSATSHSCSTYALLCMVSDWASRPNSGRRLGKVDNVNAPLQATAILKAFFEKFLTADSGSYEIDTVEGKVEIIINSSVEKGVTVNLDTLAHSAAGNVFARSPMISNGGSAPLHELIIQLTKDERKQGISLLRRIVSKTVLHSLFEWTHNAVECTTQLDMWDEVNLSRLAQLRSAKGLRNQSPAFKCSVIDVCAQTANVRHPQQFLAVKDSVEAGCMDGGRSHANEFNIVERYSLHVEDDPSQPHAC